MPKRSHPNERIKREYFIYLREARRLSDATVDAAATAIAEFEGCTKCCEFQKFRHEQAIGFKRHLHARGLSLSTIVTRLNALRAFFQWLSTQPGFKSRLTAVDADYFQAGAKEARAARARSLKPVLSLEQLQHVLAKMPYGTDIELRDRAVLAFIVLTGARDGAVRSFKLKHVDVVAGQIEHHAAEVDTKFSRSYRTYFFPVGKQFRQVTEDWIRYLQENLRYEPNDPLFPATDVGPGADGLFEARGLSLDHWSSTTPIRQIFRAAFTAAGLDYVNPHSVRSTLTRLGERVRRTPEEFKAWSQNLGHMDVLTTFSSYGAVTPERQAQLMHQIDGHKEAANDDAAVLNQIGELLRKAGRADAGPQEDVVDKFESNGAPKRAGD